MVVTLKKIIFLIILICIGCNQVLEYPSSYPKINAFYTIVSEEKNDYFILYLEREDIQSEIGMFDLKVKDKDINWDAESGDIRDKMVVYQKHHITWPEVSLVMPVEMKINISDYVRKNPYVDIEFAYNRKMYVTKAEYSDLITFKCD